MVDVHQVNQAWLKEEVEREPEFVNNKGFTEWGFGDGANKFMVGPPWDQTGQICVHHHTHYLGDFIKPANIKMPWTIMCAQATWEMPCLICEVAVQLKTAYPDLELGKLKPRHVVRTNTIREGKENDGWFVLSRGGGTLSFWNWFKKQLDVGQGGRPDILNPYSAPLIKVNKSGSGFSGTSYDHTFEPMPPRPLHYDQAALERLLTTIPNLSVVYTPPEGQLLDSVIALSKYIPTYYTKALTKGGSQSQVPQEYQGTQPEPAAPPSTPPPAFTRPQQGAAPPAPANAPAMAWDANGNPIGAPTIKQAHVYQPPAGAPAQPPQPAKPQQGFYQPPPPPPPPPPPQAQPQAGYPQQNAPQEATLQHAPPPGVQGPVDTKGLAPGQHRVCYGRFHTAGNKLCVYCPEEEACKLTCGH